MQHVHPISGQRGERREKDMSDERGAAIDIVPILGKEIDHCSNIVRSSEQSLRQCCWICGAFTTHNKKCSSARIVAFFFLHLFFALFVVMILFAYLHIQLHLQLSLSS